MLARLAQHAARWAEQGRVTEGGGREGGGGELGFQLPAFTPSLMLKIAPITGAFWGGLFSGQSRAVWSDVITQINPVTHTNTHTHWQCHRAQTAQDPSRLSSPSPAQSRGWLASARVKKSPF